MTAREKASELIVNYQLQCKSLDYQQAKQCALIAVDEIIQYSKVLNTPVKSMAVSQGLEYFEQVKQEIQNL